MIIKNKNGKEREMELLLEINKDNNKYLIYKDYVTNNIYSGRVVKNKLKVLDEDEFNYILKVIERMEG